MEFSLVLVAPTTDCTLSIPGPALHRDVWLYIHKHICFVHCVMFLPICIMWAEVKSVEGAYAIILLSVYFSLIFVLGGL
jgi:hypothetical protein